ncbi:MAG: response regulator transcription factor [Armatimonadetes bacterium]|nr:response regulator transcription factor [Armatimonadota bacterium]
MTSPVEPFRVLIVTDDPIARAGLASLLQEQPEVTVAAQVSGDADLLEAYETSQADVILWDLGWNSEAALDQLTDVRELRLPVAVLLAGVEEAAAALTAGARGLLLRNTDTSQLAAALAAVASGLTVLDPVLSGAVPPGREPTLAQPVEEMTPREREVLQLLADGLPNRAIAERLSISEHTVKFHVNAIMSKLGARTRTEAVTRAARLGLLVL